MADLSKILITGANGRIGKEISFGIKLSHKELDVTKVDEVKKAYDKYSPSGILCLSSIDIRKCEEDPLNSYRVNVLGVYNLAQEAAQRNIPVILISSGSIFNGGINRVFMEKDIPEPQNIYGQTKYLAEILVRNMMKNYLIIRTGWLFGGKVETGFTKFAKNVLLLARKNENVDATSDQVGSPTYMPDFIDNLEKLIKTDMRGVIHIVNEGAASAADFAEEIIRINNSSSEVNRLRNLNLSSLKRSESEVLASERITLRTWKKALADYIESEEI